MHVHANKLRKFHVRVDEVLYEPLVEEVSFQTANVDTLAVIYEHGADFGSLEVIEPPVEDYSRLQQLPPSKKIDPAKLEHLSEYLINSQTVSQTLQDFVTTLSMRSMSVMTSSLKDFELTRCRSV